MKFNLPCPVDALSPVTFPIVLWILLLGLGAAIYAQDRTPWNHRKCAVCLTYDDALNVHLDHAVPLLDSLGLKATFYLSGFFPSFQARFPEWKAVAANGHELGNHTLFHPCEGSAPGREWVKPDYDLNHYTRKRLVDEITMANILLGAVDGKTKRTFAYPCGDKKAGDSSYVADIQRAFIGARGVEGKSQKIDAVDLYDIGAHMINGQTGEELIRLVQNGMADHDLVVFLFHGVGGEHNLDVSLDAHRRLLQFLKKHEKDVWVAPVVDIAEFIRRHRQNGLQE
jgi:sialate O-acetylesterase